MSYGSISKTACDDRWGTGLEMQDNPTLSAAPGKYHRTSATFKSQLDFNGTLEGSECTKQSGPFACVGLVCF